MTRLPVLMKKLSLSYPQMKRASTLLALAQSEFEAATHLVDKGLYKECMVHLYFTCFYASQALLIQTIRTNPSHQYLESELHRVYGRSTDFPRKYVRVHSDLHRLRTEYDYRNTYSPDPEETAKDLKRLGLYLRFALRNVPKLETIDILKGLCSDHKKLIKDLSYDVYCPKTYSHHARITFWQPPFYLDIFQPKKIGVQARKMLKKLRVKNSDNYVVGLNSRLNQYSDCHLILLDIDALNPAVEKALGKYGGILLKSGRGFHFIGKKIVSGEDEWRKTYKRIARDKVLKKHIDKTHIDISLMRGYATLRVTASAVKPNVPFFYKEL